MADRHADEVCQNCGCDGKMTRLGIVEGVATIIKCSRCGEEINNNDD